MTKLETHNRSILCRENRSKKVPEFWDSKMTISTPFSCQSFKREKWVKDA